MFCNWSGVRFYTKGGSVECDGSVAILCLCQQVSRDERRCCCCGAGVSVGTLLCVGGMGLPADGWQQQAFKCGWFWGYSPNACAMKGGGASTP